MSRLVQLAGMAACTQPRIDNAQILAAEALSQQQAERAAAAVRAAEDDDQPLRNDDWGDWDW